MFFEEAVPASLARKLGSAVLTRTMEQRHQMGLDSYDRFFPSQDTLPKGGFGNLIALPLQGESLKHGNACFLDDDFVQRSCAAGSALGADDFRPYPDQMEVVHRHRAHDTGVLVAPTGFGKTVMAAWMIAQRKVNTLVLVHRRVLMDQWQEQLALFLGLPANEIGLYGGTRKKPTGRVDIAIMQSLYRKGQVNDLVADYGHVIVDECHHISAFSFEQVLKQAKARYILGLTATPIRKDGHHPIIIMQCGPIRSRIHPRKMADKRPFTHQVIVRHTGFSLPGENEDPTIHDVYQALQDDSQRTAAIINDVANAVAAGRSPLILTERTAHLEILKVASGAITVAR